jgi:serine protease AprX
MRNESSLLVVRADAVGGADALGAALERATGLSVRAFRGVRDPITGHAAQYLSIDAPISEVQPLVRQAAYVCRDVQVHGCTYRSASTIRADIARQMYLATGRGVVWAVLDSGIDAQHEHFARHANLSLPSPLQHVDLVSQEGNADTALVDENGHGTFIAGIIAGESHNARAAELLRDDTGETGYAVTDVPSIMGIAPECKLVSVKVLDEHARGSASTVIQALASVQRVNNPVLHIHGVSIGMVYSFDPEWFACGRTPICIEVERLVRSGVVVVIAAGNTGFGYQMAGGNRAAVQQGMEVSIGDPGNAELAITVGSTHRELPQLYGVSYFSSKGPTVDGRMKPDLVAPGEKIVSCSTGSAKAALTKEHNIDENVQFRQDSGTSLAAAHVSGAAAALLSVRRELIGRPEIVKAVLMNSATDLGRSRFYQGRGLVDVMEAVQHTYSDRSTMPDEGFATPAPTERTSTRQVAAPLAAVAPSPNTTERDAPVRVMYSYSHKDETYKQELHTYLAPQRREGLIEVWQDRQILPGSEFDKDIAQALEESDIIILLVSANFIESEYCWSKEMTRAVQRHDEGKARVVPVIVKPADWKNAPFGKLNALPKDGQPVTTSKNPDEAWVNVAEGIRRLVTAIRSRT